MTLFGMLAALQGGGAAQAHGETAARETPDLAGMLMHHLTDGHELEFQILGRGWVIHLPEWEPIHIGSLTLDLSPTKHVVFLLVAAVLLLAIFLPMGRMMKQRRHLPVSGSKPYLASFAASPNAPRPAADG